MDKNIKSKYMKNFKDHKAEVALENEDFLILDWKDRNGSKDYAVRYIVDCQNGILIISGDLGNCIASWYNPVTPDALAHYVNNISYFIEKFQCSSCKYNYRMEDIESDLESIKEEYLKDESRIYREPTEKIEKDFAEMLDLCKEITFGEDMSYPYSFIKIAEKYVNPWDESEFASLGKRIDGRVYMWAVGFQMALEQIRNPQYVSETEHI